MSIEEYQQQIKEKKAEIKEKSLILSNLVQMFKREHGCMEGDKVKVTRSSYNLESGKEEKSEHYLIIKSSFFNENLLRFQYTFSNISPNGKESKGKCAIFHHPTIDIIEKI